MPYEITHVASNGDPKHVIVKTDDGYYDLVEVNETVSLHPGKGITDVVTVTDLGITHYAGARTSAGSCAFGNSQFDVCAMNGDEAT